VTTSLTESISKSSLALEFQTTPLQAPSEQSSMTSTPHTYMIQE
jgi:hypothetical protein